MTAWRQDPPLYSPENCGWELVDDKYKIKCYNREVGPKLVEVICTEEECGVQDTVEVITCFSCFLIF